MVYAAIPYRIYQPTRAGNLPIPAKPPVNRWNTTLQATTARQAQVGEQLRTVSTSLRVVNYIPEKCSSRGTRTLGTSGATMYLIKPVTQKLPVARCYGTYVMNGIIFGVWVHFVYPIT